MSLSHSASKVWVVAQNEYLIAITSKAFLIGLFMMPIFMGGAFVVQFLTQDQVDLTPRKLAIVDETGKIFPKLEELAEARNSVGVYQGEGEERKQTQAKFELEKVDPESVNSNSGESDSDGSTRIDAVLSERVRDGDLFAFAIIEADALEVGSQAAVRYYSQSPSYQTLATWLSTVVEGEVKRQRIEQLNLSPESVAAMTMPTPLKQFGLVELQSDGEVIEAKEENRLLTLIVPFVGLMMMFMMIMSVAPAMLNNVLEEKIQKISEFLVSSITPFQLMLGKLIGSVGVGLTLSLIYLGAAFGLATYFDLTAAVPPILYVWFVFYLFIALVIFGSIFSAIGAACSEIRDAQSLMTPVMMLVIIPVMCMGPVLDSPSSLFSRAVSLFPPATPMLMFVRLAVPPGPAAWEIILGSVFAVLFAAGSVWAAGKVFRIGILSQGQAPSFAKLVGWVFSKS